MNGEALMTVMEVAAYLRMKPTTIYHWVSDRRLPFVKLGSAVRIRRRDLDDFVRRHTVRSEKNIHDRNENSNLAAVG